MKKTFKYKLLGTVFGTALIVTPALATEGMFANGSGARHRAMAGSGVAHGTDASSITLNPAAIAHVDSQVSFSVTLFNPDRDASADLDGPGPAPYTNFDDHAINWFAIPNMAINYRLNSTLVDSIGLSVSGNGGMNTSYKPGFFAGAGDTSNSGIDLQQMLITLAMAKKIGNVSVGVAPVLARQQFHSDNLASPVTGLPLASNGKKEAVWGAGVRLGIEAEVMPGLRLGGTYQSKIYMERYDKFKDLFAVSQGDLDIAANWQIGLSYDITPALTINADYRFIDYEGVKAIGAAQAIGGFEWKNTSTYKIGVEYAASEEWTLRAGYSYNTQPLDTNGAINAGLLAPGIVQHHLTAGFQKDNFMMDGLALEVAGSYAPSKELIATDSNTRIRMDQLALTAGLKWKF